ERFGRDAGERSLEWHMVRDRFDWCAERTGVDELSSCEASRIGRAGCSYDAIDDWNDVGGGGPDVDEDRLGVVGGADARGPCPVRCRDGEWVALRVGRGEKASVDGVDAHVRLREGRCHRLKHECDALALGAEQL